MTYKEIVELLALLTDDIVTSMTSLNQNISDLNQRIDSYNIVLRAANGYRQRRVERMSEGSARDAWNQAELWECEKLKMNYSMRLLTDTFVTFTQLPQD